MVPKPPLKDNRLLLEAFQSFSQAADQLQTAYAELKEHSARLNLELEQANARLSGSLAEQERLNHHFLGILQAMKTAILVVELDGTVMEINAAACTLLALQPQRRHYQELPLPEALHSLIRHCMEHTLSRMPRREFTWQREQEEWELEAEVAPVRAADGQILSLLILVQDVTLVNRLRKQSQRTARLAAMGEMAAELAHEIRNPLGSIKLLGNLLAEDLSHEPERRPLTEQLNQSIQTIDAILANMLTFSGEVTPRMAALDLVTCLREWLGLVERDLAARGMKLCHGLDQPPLVIPGDAMLLKQVFLNLLLNAIKAMADGHGMLKIDLQRGEDYVEVRIEDNGCGIRKEHLAKVFDPFFSQFQGGTGLGLSVVHKIVEKHRGAIEIKSQQQRGTAVYVSLPRHESAPEVRQP